MDPRDEQFRTMASELISEIRHHVDEEENDALPRLERAFRRAFSESGRE